MKFTYIVLTVCACTFLFFPGYSQTELVLERIDGFAASDRITDLELDRNNVVLVASRQGIYTMSRSALKPEKKLDISNALAVKKTRRGDIISGYTDRSVYFNNTLMGRIEDELAEITDIEVFKNMAWVGTHRGVYLFNIGLKKYTRQYDKSNSALKSDMVNFVFKDNNDILWIGTDRGVVRIKNDKWKVYDQKLKMLAIAENKEGVWLVSNEEMWLIDNDNRWYPVGLNRGLYAGKINDITLDKDGNLFLASDKLVKLNPYTNRIEKWGETLGLLSQRCLSLACDSDGTLFLGTADAGLYRISNKKIEVEEMSLASILENTISCYGESDGSIILEVTGGQAPYTYMWEPVRLKGPNPTHLRSGSYSVTVEDAFGNKKYSSVTLEDPNPIKVEVLVKNAVSRAGRKDGNAEIRIDGGTYPYDIAWDNGETGPKARNLNFGFNYLTITDSNGCSVVETINIDKPKILPELDIAKVRIGQTLQIEKLFFAADSSTFNAASIDVLDEVYTFLNENDKVVIEIGGHTNNIPPDDYCDELSTNRARNVAEYLYRKGITEDRINYKGYGKRNPIASNESVAGRRKNQRVEIKILDIGSQ